MGTAIEYGIAGTVTIDALGRKIEYGIHAAMHDRFGDYSTVGLRPNHRDLPVSVDHDWNDVQYDSLLDFYSAHLNPLFWKIHGWIDDRIKDWEDANDTTADFFGRMGSHPRHDHTPVPDIVVRPRHHATEPTPAIASEHPPGSP